MPFSKLAKRYKEFAKLFADTPLANITTWQIEKWKAEQGRTLNLATVNRRLTVIKHMFKKALEWDLTKANPATAVKRFTITSERTRFLSGGEIQRLLRESEKQITSPGCYRW